MDERKKGGREVAALASACVAAGHVLWDLRCGICAVGSALRDPRCGIRCGRSPRMVRTVPPVSVRRGRMLCQIRTSRGSRSSEIMSTWWPHAPVSPPMDAIRGYGMVAIRSMANQDVR